MWHLILGLGVVLLASSVMLQLVVFIIAMDSDLFHSAPGLETRQS